ncbi:MAG: transcription-repair coupling factor [candidate division Zixibacteria bacterium RBG_16_50_21]|nr:MAG: transcription-repair coupling factor [candidate division Zixibacteria bacterium RBG_16_50_21]
MAPNNLIGTGLELGSLRELIRAIEKGERKFVISGWAGSGKAWLLASLFQQLDRPMAVICSKDQEAEDLKNDLETFLGKNKVWLFPSWETDILQPEAPDSEIISERLEALARMTGGAKGIVVIPVQALFEHTLPPERLKQSTYNLETGQELELLELVSALERLGFKRTAWVEEVGEYSVRGGILDLFPYSLENPVRIEFFGSQIESIRTFSVLSQRSLARLESVSLLPLREYSLSLEEINRKLEGLPPESRKVLEAPEFYQSDQPGWEWLAMLLGYSDSTVLDYLSKESLIVQDETEVLQDKQKDILWVWQNILAERNLSSFSPVLEKLGDTIELRLTNFQSALLQALPVTENSDYQRIDLGMLEPPFLAGNFKLLEQTLQEFKEKNYNVCLICDSQKQKERLQEILEENGEMINWQVGALTSGFVVPDLRLAVLVDHQIFGRVPNRYPPREFKEGMAISSYKSLNPGDFVVHIDYGIGKFAGLRSLNLDGRNRECLEIDYAGDDKLYVPVEEFRLVQKFIGKEGDPTLSKIGGTSWERAKARTKKAIMEMAEDLIKLYAERKAKPGYAFSQDNVWQKELEASFPYQETPDQLKAIEEVKNDMQLPHAMDRLVCGDVGYGKTEVALRSAFKAVLDHRQVAVLVPTTILAFQHFNTFSQRLKDFPVRVEMLSRFRTRTQQKKLLEELNSGKIDIVIGTHMLLQNKVTFKDLGLLVIDEEHRFGVAQKEKIKTLKKQVDVLSLTATPIPRTMQMALFGARDMSTINTPPAGRLSIQTEIVRFSPQVIARAILHEMGRGGQVFFVHNRIQTIEGVYRLLKDLLSEFRVAVAHGQMPETRLEKIMLDFTDRKYDLLLSTTIIESGLDMRNVNTIIINRADKFGLAELYQLRGRVGRSDRKAYAYLLVPPDLTLQEAARKRLKALEQFSELGSGFQLALKDLEIRGAGNLLGPQQHGYIEEVGIDLYFRLLEEAVQELKGEKRGLSVQSKIETSLEACLPQDYVAEPRQRIEIYTKLSEARNPEELREVESELKDRFGPIPEPTGMLLRICRLRIAAQMHLIEKIVLQDKQLKWVYSPQARWNRERMEKLSGQIKLPAEFKSQGGLEVAVKTGRDQDFNLEWVTKLLQSLSQELY